MKAALFTLAIFGLCIHANAQTDPDLRQPLIFLSQTYTGSPTNTSWVDTAVANKGCPDCLRTVICTDGVDTITFAIDTDSFIDSTGAVYDEDGTWYIPVKSSKKASLEGANSMRYYPDKMLRCIMCQPMHSVGGPWEKLPFNNGLVILTEKSVRMEALLFPSHKNKKTGDYEPTIIQLQRNRL